jgi:5'-3' exonuclease
MEDNNTKNKRILIIDGTNIFLRSYLVNPTLSRNGEPIGGIVGSLQSLQKFTRESNPDKIVWAWDGYGGSKRRKQKDKNYKAGRSPGKINWDAGGMNDKEQEDNKRWQMSRLAEHLLNFPIHELIFDSVEADDVISFVAQHQLFSDWFKVIVSSDKDFIQLLNNKTILYRPTQKEVLTVKRVVEKYEIHPNNFLLARAIAGDDSDNLKGVDGVGFKTVAKRFPFLKEEKQYFIEDILKASQDTEKKKIKCYQNVLAEERKIRDNHSIMQLSFPQFSVQDKESITNNLQEKPKFGRSSLLIEMQKDSFPDINFETLFQISNRIVANSQ